jgi:PAS domain S-box-containing protein/putative nucleotidyltransferase with HDIG domain
LKLKTEDKQAYTTTKLPLKVSELRYRRLFEAAQDGILILDAEKGFIEDVNPYLIKMLGYSREEFVKKKLWEMGAFRDIQASQNAFEALQEHEYIRYEDLPLKAKDGRLIQVEFVSNVYLEDGQKVIQCNIRDITARKQAECDLQESETRLRKALTGQIALVEENVSLFESLQRSNQELMLAYDATIEGWSHAMDLRDNETEGHTQRVTGMTVKLARAIGLSEAELVQVRWGSLLHDIGKMGVPDQILHKPGPLTGEEWVKMKKHPTFAFEMLAPIHYLRLALDIPYCHHEKWDGSGYPNGLKGDQIPLFARIFAVVDVWDALNSNRPYRTAWNKDVVREYIQNTSGMHFDPQVVDVFMQLPG